MRDVSKHGNTLQRRCESNTTEQGYSFGGTHTTVGTRRIVWWRATLFGNYSVFHNSILNMLIILLKLFKCI